MARGGGEGNEPLGFSRMTRGPRTNRYEPRVLCLGHVKG